MRHDMCFYFRFGLRTLWRNFKASFEIRRVLHYIIFLQIQKKELIAPFSLFGGGVGFKTEHRHRGMKFGFALHSVDNWVQALPAGGDEENRTPVRKPLDITFFVDSLLFRIPL